MSIPIYWPLEKSSVEGLAERDDDVSDLGRGADLGFAGGHREKVAGDARRGAVVEDTFVDVDVWGHAQWRRTSRRRSASQVN
jgi:hypothetical protein